MTLPIIAPSRTVTFNNNGAKITNARISNVAGTNAKSIEDVPTFFKSFKSKDNPACKRIITKAISLSSGDNCNNSPEIKFQTKGPNKTPVNNKPIM